MSFQIYVVPLAAIQALPALKQVYEEHVALHGNMSGNDMWNLCILNMRLLTPEWDEKLSQAQYADESAMGLN